MLKKHNALASIYLIFPRLEQVRLTGELVNIISKYKQFIFQIIFYGSLYALPKITQPFIVQFTI